MSNIKNFSPTAPAIYKELLDKNVSTIPLCNFDDTFTNNVV